MDGKAEATIKYKIIVISLIVAIVISAAVLVRLIIASINNQSFFGSLSYSYSTQTIPPTTYSIEIDTTTKKLRGEFYHSCSAVDCDSGTTTYVIDLTDDEYDKIRYLWDDEDARELLSSAIESICRGDKIMYNSFENSYETDRAGYDEMDQNQDGKISNREFGDRFLDYIIAEN